LFEQNVDTETRSIRSSFLPGLEPLTVSKSVPVKTYTVGQAIECDMTLGSFDLVVGKPLVQAQKGLIAVVKLQGTGTVTVRPVLPMKINGAATKVYAAAGLAFIYFDGSQFYG
jgi:hypothetical protein